MDKKKIKKRVKKEPNKKAQEPKLIEKVDPWLTLKQAKKEDLGGD